MIKKFLYHEYILLLKKFLNYIDKEKKCVRLHPENRTMNDILVKSCYIQGVAQHVIKAL